MKYTVFILFVLTTLACDDGERVAIGPPIKQYATSVINYSSQYSTGNWSANRALGPENVFPNYGDYVNAWASSTADTQREFLELGFDTLQTVRIVEIYETYYPGAIDTVYLRSSETQTWNTVYSKPAVPLGDTVRKLSIYLNQTEYLVDAIRIAINSPIDSLLKEHENDVVYGWNEIDAVAISGFREEDP